MSPPTSITDRLKRIARTTTKLSALGAVLLYTASLGFRAGTELTIETIAAAQGRDPEDVTKEMARHVAETRRGLGLDANELDWATEGRPTGRDFEEHLDHELHRPEEPSELRQAMDELLDEVDEPGTVGHGSAPDSMEINTVLNILLDEFASGNADLDDLSGELDTIVDGREREGFNPAAWGEYEGIDRDDGAEQGQRTEDEL